jgi:hypothetical protein
MSLASSSSSSYDARDVRFSEFPREKNNKKIKKKNNTAAAEKKAHLSRFCPTPLFSLSL